MSYATKLPLVACFLGCLPALSWAAGLAVTEQNASRLGTAYAGGAAEASDPSVIFTNPAGLSQLKGRQLSISGLGFLGKAQFHDAGSSSAAGTPATGDDGGNAATSQFIPNLYYSNSFSRDVTYGLGISAPAGVGLDYGNTWVGRYYNTAASLQVIDISPAIAIRVAEHTSVGAALDIQYAHAKLSKALDFGSAFAGQVPGFAPQQNDGYAEVKGNDWAAGYHLGVRHEFGSGLVIGAQYRSKVTHTLEGNAKFSNVPSFAAGAFASTGDRTTITLPEVVSLSVLQPVTSKFTLLGDVSWTRWSRFKELRIRFDNGIPADDVTAEQWRNSWRYALGANYRYTEHLLLRAGVAYDRGPVHDDLRNPAIPDQNRLTLATGVGYALSPTSSLDVGYAYITMQDAAVNLASPDKGTLTGRYKNNAHVFGVQYNQRF